MILLNIEKQNTGRPKIAIKCECGKTLGFIVDGDLQLKCRACKRVKVVKLKAKSEH